MITNTKLIELLQSYPADTPIRGVEVDGFEFITVELSGFDTSIDRDGAIVELHPVLEVSASEDEITEELPEFVECGQCGYFHDIEDSDPDHKFTRSELDAQYGLTGYKIQE